MANNDEFVYSVVKADMTTLVETDSFYGADRYKIQTGNGDLVDHSSHFGKTLVFNHSFDPSIDKLVKLGSEDAGVSSFVAINAERKIKSPIDKETYDKLTDSLKKLYKEETVTKRVVAEKTYSFNSFDDKIRDTEDEFFANRMEVFKYLADYNHKRGNHFKFEVTFPQDSSFRGYTPGTVEVKFFEKEYNGEMRKVLERKKNGQPYVDRRGRNVPDYPEIVDRLIITEKDVPYFSAKTKEQLDDKLQEYVDFITMKHLIPQKKEEK